MPDDLAARYELGREYYISAVFHIYSEQLPLQCLGTWSNSICKCILQCIFNYVHDKRHS